MAAGLVDHGMVLPVLDGLDEVDPLRADGTPDPEAPRARAVLEALNAYQDGREAGPLVLTCRTGHYDALAPVSRLIDAARITIAPISTHQAIAYLRARALDTPRWQPLVDHLETQPASPLATTLSTPWRLCLTATVYHRDGNPSELLHHADGHDLDQHLLARYVPATIANTRNPHRYQPEDVHRWLHHLTSHLSGSTTGTPATDLTLHHLWTLAGTTRVRITDIILTTLTLVLAPFVLASLLGSDDFGNSTETLIFFTAFSIVASIIAFRPTPRPNRLGITRGTFQGGFVVRFWARFKTWFGFGFAIGFTLIFTDELPGLSLHTIGYGLGTGIVLGIGSGLIGGFMGGLAGGFADGFKAWFRIWFTVGLVVSLGLSLAIEYGLVEGVGSGLGGEPGLGLSLGFWLGHIGGLAGGFMRGLAGEPSAVANPREIIRDDVFYGLLMGPMAGLLVLQSGFAILWPYPAGNGYGHRVIIGWCVDKR
ncbi:hypothetical protein AB0E67_35965, partial [Streptomyces sp. NPDC032161]